MKYIFLSAILAFAVSGCSVNVHPLPGVNIHLPAASQPHKSAEHKAREQQSRKKKEHH